jgi:hypothetical protein
MATGCTAHPELWNTHANNCIAAASEIDRLETLCGHIVELLRDVSPPKRDWDHDGLVREYDA